jgi:hypothetical protein
MSKRRQKRAQLRALECLAYSSTISYLRSQIDDDKEAKYILEHLRTLLHISSHRHLAELKRILNDEELERLSAIKHIGENHLKHQWIELEEEEENKLNKKKFKTT